MPNAVLLNCNVSNRKVQIQATSLVLVVIDGDFWHGNPLRFDPKDMNKKAGKTFGELYQKVIDKENEFKNAGYNIVSIWELDWKNMKKINEPKTIIQEDSRTS
jgi:CTP synthase (UTP-ammonia lyase)